MKLRFLGGVKGVTGSCHYIEYNKKKILLDCGMFQGRDEDFNLQELEVSPAEIDYLFLSHSHIDHSGRIPLLVKRGFKGIIYCTKPTYDLCEIMLVDSAHIQETETEWKNRKNKRSGRKLIEPIYIQRDAIDSFQYFKPVLYEQIIDVDENLRIRFRDAGHILGSSIIEMWFNVDNKTIKVVFSGDLGMNDKPLLKDPTIIESADYVIIEATYGNRIHENVAEKTEELINIILNTARKGGTVVIPSFAVGRTQEIIYELNKYYDDKCKTSGINNELKRIPVYIDSPLASKATEVFKRNSLVFDDEARADIFSGDNPLEFENLHFTQSPEESKALNFSLKPKIIISASGMCEAGRIKHHLKHNLWREESSIVFVGYQAEGTLGRKIADGEKNVKIFGEEIHINAEIHDIEGFSGHADKIGLLNWLKGFKYKPKKVFIVHGEANAKEEFAKEAEHTLNMKCIVPQYETIYDIKAEDELEEINVFDSVYSDGAVVLNKEKKIIKLTEDVEKLRKLFDDALKLTQNHLNNENIKKESLIKINNNILELENEILNLTILSGK